MQCAARSTRRRAAEALAANPRLSAVERPERERRQQYLYFADPSLRLFGFDLATAKPFAVGHNPERLVVGGVEAMCWYIGCLVIDAAADRCTGA